MGTICMIALVCRVRDVLALPLPAVSLTFPSDGDGHPIMCVMRGADRACALGCRVRYKLAVRRVEQDYLMRFAPSVHRTRGNFPG